jgi:hypothetical protein
MAAAHLNQVREEIATDPTVFYFIGAFATTHWTPEARNTLAGSNYLIALCDFVEEAWRVYYAPDPRWGLSIRLFDLTTYEEKLDALRRFVERHTFDLLMDELGEDFVSEKLGYPAAFVREAFETVERDMDFVRLDTSSKSWRLIRVYS